MKKLAYIVMGQSYDPDKHCALFEAGNSQTLICTVQNFEQAKKTVEKLVAEGVGAIEICGAFGKDRASELFSLTGQKVPVSYVVTAEGQEELVSNFFKN